ncbi:sulfotransferase [Streptosporangium violaceochromogenes]|nr:sulfotransferase [Streptosporangium violaceochromogenes]
MSDNRPCARVVFLGGLGRSGTTLLERLLGEVPGVAPLGEVVHLWARGVLADEPCGCREPFGRCPFWREVGERAFGGWSAELAHRMLILGRRVGRTRHIPALARRVAHGRACGRQGVPTGGTRRGAPGALEGPGAPEVPEALGTSERPGAPGAPRSPAELPAELEEYAAVHRRLYDAAGAVAGRPVVVDSSKHASLAFCLAATGSGVHVVHVVRDPRAVAHSWHGRTARPEDGRPMTRWSPARTSLHWLAQNLGLELLARSGVRVLRVRYEDLLASPAGTLGRLAGEIGLHPHPGLLRSLNGGEAELSPSHTVSGNPVRFVAGRIGLVEDDRWRTASPAGHRRLVTTMTWPLMVRYGYRGRLA